MGGIVGGDEGPVSGVAQVDCHGVKVVGVHGEVGQEEDGEVRREVKGEVEQLREKRSSWMVWRWVTDSRDLEPMWCDVSMRMTRQPKQRAGVLRTYLLRMSVCVVSLLSLSTLVLKVVLVVIYTFA